MFLFQQTIKEDQHSHNINLVSLIDARHSLVTTKINPLNSKTLLSIASFKITSKWIKSFLYFSLKPVDIFLLSIFWLKLVDRIHHSKLLAILTNRLFMFRHGHWIYADGQGLPSVPCLLVLLPFVVFLFIRSPFVTENQLQVSNKLMEHGTNGTTCHQEHLRLNEDGIAGRS